MVEKGPTYKLGSNEVNNARGVTYALLKNELYALRT
jgi:hypothetical protein